MFSDNMIIQRDTVVPVWGSADPGSEITVAFAGQTVTAKADASGNWEARLQPLSASTEPRDLTVKAILNSQFSILNFHNVLVGDVWLASGQSNMEYCYCWWPKCRGDMLNFITNTPILRFQRCTGFQNIPRENSPFKYDKWQIIEKDGPVFQMTTCVGSIFAREIIEATDRKIPIGIIDTSIGGINIEKYIDPQYATLPGYGKAVKSIGDFHREKADPTSEGGRKAWAKYFADAKAALADYEGAIAEGRAPRVAVPDLPCSHPYWTGCFQAMIVPWSKFPIKGAIWYQGCGNSDNGFDYEGMLGNMFYGWRKAWGYDFPCYWVQLAAYENRGVNDIDPEGGKGFAKIREGMRRAMKSIPNGGMAVIFDVGNPKDIHPNTKVMVGRRLAKWALHNDYGFDGIVPSGPNYRELKIEGDKARVFFDYVGSGLATAYKNNFDDLDPVPAPGEPLVGFSIAGADKKWYFADAIIDGDTVVVSSKDVKEPVAVRYAYRTSPLGANLYNTDLLPASPFKTDEWDE